MRQNFSQDYAFGKDLLDYQTEILFIHPVHSVCVTLCAKSSPLLVIPVYSCWASQLIKNGTRTASS